MANIDIVLEVLKAGKAICTNLDVRMDNKCANVTSATWQMLGFNKAGQLVGYNYQLKAEDFKSAYDACFLQVRMKTSEPSKFIAKAQWAFGKTPAECVAQALNEQKIDGCFFVAKNATTVYTKDANQHEIADVTYVFYKDSFYITSIY